MEHIISYLKQMVGIKYKWWIEGDIINHNPPFYSDNIPSTNRLYKKKWCLLYQNQQVPGLNILVIEMY